MLLTCCGDNDRKCALSWLHAVKEDHGIRNLMQPVGCQDGQMNCRPPHIWRRSISAESSVRLPNVHFLLQRCRFWPLCLSACFAERFVVEGRSRADGVLEWHIWVMEGSWPGLRAKNIRLSGVMEHLWGRERRMWDVAHAYGTRGGTCVLIHWPVGTRCLKALKIYIAHLTVNNQKCQLRHNTINKKIICAFDHPPVTVCDCLDDLLLDDLSCCIWHKIPI